MKFNNGLDIDLKSAWSWFEFIRPSAALIECLLKLALLVISVVAYVPFAPKLPAASLDSSWALGLNQAVAQGLAFGKDIIFTLGPYSSIYTKAYHPATSSMMFGGSLYLACSCWLCLLCLMQNTPWRWTCALAVLLACMLCSRDAMLFSYALIAALAGYKLALMPARTGLMQVVFMSVFFAPFGLLVLVKGTLLLLCAAVLIVSVLLLFGLKQYRLACCCCTAPLVSMLLFWLGCGQSLIDLPNYLMNTLYIATVFTEAMAMEIHYGEISAYLISAGVILCVIAWQKQLPRCCNWFLISVFFIFLLIAFKSGFTRHFGHVFIAGTAILMAALLLPFVVNSRLTVPVILLSLAASHYIESQNGRISMLENFSSTYSGAWHGLSNWMHNSAWLQQDYALSMGFLKNQASLPLLEGTSDIYSSNQTYLIASGNQWSPRPILQSYSVFNGWLALQNKQHLLAAGSPDNIFFKLEPIDNRLPALEDGASWPLLLSRYQPTQMSNEFIVLKKKLLEGQTNSLLRPLSSEQQVLGEPIQVPYVKHRALFVNIDLLPTVWGQLATLLLMPTKLQINVLLENGLMKHYRFIANMGSSGFLISPLIETTDEFLQLYANNRYLEEKRVKSISITTSERYHWQWNQQFRIKFSYLV
ncbi:MAG: hypothetical protein ACHP65_06125 [Legionellales bacterium]